MGKKDDEPRKKIPFYLSDDEDYDDYNQGPRYPFFVPCLGVGLSVGLLVALMTGLLTFGIGLGMLIGLVGNLFLRTK